MTYTSWWSGPQRRRAQAHPIGPYLSALPGASKGGVTWERLPDAPSPVTGAPSICDESGSLVVFGGDNGSLAEQITTLKDQHPGFSLKTLHFDLHDAAWSAGSQLPVSLVTTGATFWDGQFVIAGGENQPGHRSSRCDRDKDRWLVVSRSNSRSHGSLPTVWSSINPNPALLRAPGPAANAGSHPPASEEDRP